MTTVSMTAPRRAAWRLTACAAAIALAGMAFTVAQAQTPPHPPAAAGAGMHGWAGGPGMGFGDGAQMHERMLDQAGASAEQKAKVREIFGAAHKDLRAQFEAGRTLHAQMAQLLTAPTLDAAAVEALRQKMLAQHDAASKRVVQAMLDASAVLTPEQRQKIAQRMQQRREMFERHRRERQALDAPQG
jgi:periplasmic protein CpxP/Spy